MDYPEIPGYEITGVIGQGAMGCVYRGRHREDGQDVAIKALLVEDPSMARALANEYEVLCRVEHPYLVNEREVVEWNSHHFLVMEYIESVPLSQWIETTPRAQRLEKGAEILDKVCEVLEYLHSQDPPVIVRDLKPDNILICPNGDIKLIDFGIARALEGGAKTEVALKGFASAAYAPLEQYSAQSTTSPASDVYSLGATTYHMVSGNLPVPAIDMTTQGQQPEKMLLDLGVEPVWASLVGSAMRNKPGQRISISEFRQRIPRLQNREKGASTNIAPRSTVHLPPPRTQDSNWKWMVALAIVCGLLALAIFLPAPP